jgi:hypothetical protein
MDVQTEASIEEFSAAEIDGLGEIEAQCIREIYAVIQRLREDGTKDENDQRKGEVRGLSSAIRILSDLFLSFLGSFGRD